MFEQFPAIAGIGASSPVQGDTSCSVSRRRQRAEQTISPAC